MPKRARPFVPYMLFFAGVVVMIVIIMQPISVYKFRILNGVLFPAGVIAIEQRNLLFIIQAVMLLVMIPVYLFTFIFSWKYRAHNPKGEDYDPDLIDNTLAEYVWWGLPLILTICIFVLTYFKTHELDPYKPIQSDKKSVKIQAIALQWKWLFLYPEEKIAVVNFLQFPKDAPLQFEITADAPMNALWIPHLGGMIYAMPSMRTELNLIANELGEFRGCSANISGVGFSGMHFIAKSSSDEDYKKWVEEAKKSAKKLDVKEYEAIAKPSENSPVEIYQLADDSLFNHIIMKYMEPQKT